MGIPKRLQQQSGRYSLVDSIPFKLPVACDQTPVLMASGELPDHEYWQIHRVQHCHCLHPRGQAGTATFAGPFYEAL